MKLLAESLVLGLVLVFGFSSPTVLAKSKKTSDFKEIEVNEDSDDSASSAEETKEATSVAESAKPVLGENEEVLSGTVRVLRRIDRTEAFFKDLKNSYVIPSGSGYSRIYKSFEESQKKGSPVSFKVNSKSRQVLSIESAGSGAGSARGAAAPSSADGGSR